MDTNKIHFNLPVNYHPDNEKAPGDIPTGALRRLRALETVLDCSDHLIFASDVYTDELIFVNRAFSIAAGAAPERLTGRSCSAALRAWAENADELNITGSIIAPDGSIAAMEHSREFYNRTNGRWYLVRCVLISWIDGALVRLETATDITPQKEREAHLRHFASTDDMTGLYLREYGSELIRQILGGEPDSPGGSLVFIDFDDLKLINDCYGHTAGDRALIMLTELIVSTIRKSDTLCRWGGDEFVLILRAEPSDATRIMKKIQNKIASHNSTAPQSEQLRFSFGIAPITPASGKDVCALIAEADREMYKQKMSK